MNRILTLFFFLSIITLTSCSISSETKFYADKSSSAEMMIKMDPLLVNKMNAQSKDKEKKIHGKSIKDLPKDWVSYYDLFSDSLKKSTTFLQSDTAKLLKHIYIKYLVENGNFAGFGMKCDRLNESELEMFGKHFNDLNPGKSIDSLRPTNAMEPKTQWDGKKLTIYLGKGNKGVKNSKSKTKDKKSEEKNPFESMITQIFKDANIVMTYKYSFEQKIKSIKGKHDFLRKVDDHTIVYELDFKKLKEMQDQGKKMHKSSSEISVITE